MFRPAHPRVMNFRPRINQPHNVHWRQNSDPRAFYSRNNSYRPRPSLSLDQNNQDYWCETCDRGFPTAKHLEDHKLQHQKCNIDGCQFVAHPKVITRHIQMQHSSGLYKRIAKLDNPEEVKKWLEERKKNFPTISNIEKKAAERKEKIDRGEKMGLKQGNRFRDPGNKRKFDPSIKKGNDPTDLKKRKSFCESKIIDIKKKPVSSNLSLKYLPPPEDTHKLMTFNGIQELVMNMQADEEIKESNDDLLIEDDDNEEIVEDRQEKSNSGEPVLCGALVSLMCQYGSSDEEENSCQDINQPSAKMNTTTSSQNQVKNKQGKEIERNIVNLTSSSSHGSPKDNDGDNDDDSGPEECKVVKIVEVKGDASNENEVSGNVKKKQHDGNNEDDSGPEECKVVKHIGAESNESNTKEIPRNIKKKQHDRKVHKPIHHRKPKSNLPSTLLQKLLFKEVRHERNMVLQCVRYIVKNNYFDK